MTSWSEHPAARRRPSRRVASSLRYYVSSLPTLVRGVRTRRDAARLALGVGTSPVRIRLGDGTLLWLRSAVDLWLAKETCLDLQYEDDRLELSDAAVVIDIGASIGDFAVSFARRHPRSVVHAFEPHPDSFRLPRSCLPEARSGRRLSSSRLRQVPGSPSDP